MSPSRAKRLLAVVLAVFSLLYTQFATAAYICPGAAAASVAMTHCAGMDAWQPGLCHAQGHKPEQAAAHSDLPPVPPFLFAGLVLEIVPAGAAGQRPDLIRPRAGLTRSTAPPIAIRHCCFRI